MSSFVVTVGSYETPIYGFQGDIRKRGDDDYSLSFRELFAHSSHLGCVKSVAASGKWLASSSTDETVKCAVPTDRFFLFFSAPGAVSSPTISFMLIVLRLHSIMLL